MPPPALFASVPGWDAWVATITGAGDDWLVELLSRRSDLAMAGAQDLEALAAAVISPASVRSCFDLADRTTRQVIEAICVLARACELTPAAPPAGRGSSAPAPGDGPAGTDVAALAAALGVEPDGLRPVVEELRLLALVLPGAPGPGPALVPGRLVPNPGLERAVPYPAGLAGPARQMLVRQPVRELSEIAARLGAPAKGAKAVVMEAVARALSSPSTVRAVVAAGPPGTSELARRLAAEPLEVTLGWGVYETGRSDRTVEGWLLRRGMLVPTAWGSAMMPAEAALALRGGRLFESFTLGSPPLVVGPVDQAGVDREAAEAALALCAEVASILDAWGEEPAKLLRSGGLGVREVRRLAKLTGRTEAHTARLVELAAGAGLAGEEGETALPAVDYDPWQDLSQGGRWAELAGAWLAAPVHLSLAGSSDERGKPIPPLLPRGPEPDAIARRRLVLELMAHSPEGQALDRPSAATRLDWVAPAVWQGGPAAAEQLVAWVFEEAEMLGVSARGALSCFGRQLLAAEPASAAATLDRFAPPLTSEIVLQADFTAVVAGQPAPALRRDLDLMADVESTGAASVYRFSEASLRRAFDAGRNGEEIVAWLEDHAAKGVPQPLRYLVDDLARRFGRARVGAAAAYLRSEDVALLTEVVRARKTARLHLRLLAPTVAVSDAGRDTVVRVLREAGYLAAAEEADGSLSLVRPPVRRATPGNGPDSLAAIEELLADEEALAAFVGLPSSALPAGLAAAARQLLGGPSGRGGLDGAGDFGGFDLFDFDEADFEAAFTPVDPRELVARLRAGPGPSRPPAPRSASRVPVDGQLFAHLEPFAPEVPRPTGIAKGSVPVGQLLGLAAEQDWTVRLSYLDARRREVDLYADVVDVGGQAVELYCYPDGEERTVPLATVNWVRVVTEAEEEVLDQ